jgi:translation initiation factor 6
VEGPARRFEISKLSISGNPNVGVFIHATDTYIIVPPGLAEKEVKVVRDVLGVDRIVEGTVFNMRLLGVLVAGNNNGLLLPRTITDDELRVFKKALGDINIAVVDTVENALGNLVAANSRAAVVYPYFEPKVVKVIEDTLGVEAHRMAIGGISVVGSVLVVTDRGGLVCPEASEDEVKKLSSIFKVPVVQGTVNFGVSFIRAGLVANSNGALVGEDTTGPELARIQMALGGGGGGG